MLAFVRDQNVFQSFHEISATFLLVVDLQLPNFLISASSNDLKKSGVGAKIIINDILGNFSETRYLFQT